jgi:AraC-like DNA-binding protein
VLQTQHRINAAILPALKQLCSKECLEDIGDAECGLDLNATSMSCVRLASLLEDLDGQILGGGIGIKFASQFKLGDTGLFGLALMNAPSFRHALEFFTHFLPLVADHSSFKSSLGNQNAHLEWNYSPFLQNGTNYIDFCIGLSLRQFQQFHLPGWKPLSVSLQRPRTDQGPRHFAAFSNVMRFECESHVMEFTPSSLQSTNPHADFRVFDTLVDLCEVHLSNKKKSITFENQMKDFILCQLGNNSVTLASLSGRFGLNSRTMQRRLSSLGSSFEKLVLEVQREYSDFLLFETKSSIEDIGNKLGFSATASYSRVAHDWYGVPASQVRSQLN